MTDAENRNDEQRHAIEEEAVAWLVRLRGDRSGTGLTELEEWLAQSTEHRRAYDWANRHFDASKVLKASQRHGQRRTFGTHDWLMTAAMAAAITVVIALGITFRSEGQKEGASQQARSSPVLQTLPGQIDAVELADGSKVTMDARSRLTVSMDGKERRLQFQQGRARIAVNTDGRPFVVVAGQGELLTRSAHFDISRNSDGRIEIAVLSGEIELRSLLRPAAMRTYRHYAQAGQSIAYPAQDFRPVALSSQGIDRRDWPQGWTEYSSTPLRILIADANRYAQPPIVLDDPALGALLVSGRFRLTETDRFSARIAGLFDLALSRRPNAILLQRQ
jgi:transmembrane sensor